MDKFVGQNFRGMMVNLQKIHGFEMSPEDLDANVENELGAVISSLRGEGEGGSVVKPCKGVDVELKKLADSGKYLMSVVSSSAYPRVWESVALTNQLDYFHDGNGAGKDAVTDFKDPTVRIYSAATSMDKPVSKPDPAIYIWAMFKLGFMLQKKQNPDLQEPALTEKGETDIKAWSKFSLDRETCVAVEDSVSGATAAARAGIPTIGYTGSYEPHEVPEKTKALEKLVAVMMKDWSEFDACMKAIEEGATNATPPL